METKNYTKENFHLYSKAIFSNCETPETTPDYVSLTKNGKVSSKYFFTENGVIRVSNHWGSVGTCVWILKGFSTISDDCEFSNIELAGYCSFEMISKTTNDFTAVMQDAYNLYIEECALITDNDEENAKKAGLKMKSTIKKFYEI